MNEALKCNPLVLVSCMVLCPDTPPRHLRSAGCIELHPALCIITGGSGLETNAVEVQCCWQDSKSWQPS
jgi:hypothetical protein